MTPREKMQMAEQLAELGVDIIEAGFPIASPQDFQAVRDIAKTVKGPVIAGLARARTVDIERAAEAVEPADRARIHTFIATSDIHLTHKLRMSEDECLDQIRDAVSHARRYCDDVEFSAEDATRTDLDFLCKVAAAAIEAGAGTINIPDTVGYAIPDDFRKIMTTLFDRVPGIDDVVISVHCHNDLGLAVANSLTALQHGARQVECTINGIGERAGNASLEEIVMSLRVRPDLGDWDSEIHSERIWATSQLLSHITGIRPQPNKAIVGENAFAHEAGIHQDGMIKNRMTYEIMTPEMVGATGTKLVLGKHSGQHALLRRYEEMGFELGPEQLQQAYKLFIRLADQKKEILDEDLLAIYYHGTMEDLPRYYRLDWLEVTCGRSPSHARVRVVHGDGPPAEASASGDGPIEAAYDALDQLTDWTVELLDLSIQSTTPERDAVGDVHIHVDINGNRFTGRAASTDVVDAAVRAYLHAVNKAEHARTLEAQAFEKMEMWGV